MGYTYNIGIDLGGTNIDAGIVDDNNRVLARAQLPTNLPRTYTETIADMGELIKVLCESANVHYTAIGSVGVASAGLVNKTAGIVEFSSNLCWNNVPLKHELANLTKMPVHIENDANAAAYGEYLAGAAKGYNTSFHLTIGTGIGGGFINDGKIYDGANFAANEVGHVVICKGGRPCLCGRSGCFERYASAAGLVLTAEEYITDEPLSMLWDMTCRDTENLSAKLIFEADALGDPTAKRIVRTYIGDLACGIANLINIYQPDILTIGGGVSAQKDTLLVPLLEIVMSEVYSRNSEKNTVIAIAELGNDAGIIGAANLYLEQEED
jgi:glucokinase